MSINTFNYNEKSFNLKNIYISEIKLILQKNKIRKIFNNKIYFKTFV